MTKNDAKLPTSKAKTAYGLLSEVRKLILEEPLRYNQGCWIYRSEGAKGMPACGTVACVAGWIVTLKRLLFSDLSELSDAAKNTLGLNDDAADELFSDLEVKGTPQTKAHAKNGAAHIEKFQKKYAAQLKAKRV